MVKQQSGSNLLALGIEIDISGAGGHVARVERKIHKKLKNAELPRRQGGTHKKQVEVLDTTS
jgi:hypothetical protein